MVESDLTPREKTVVDCVCRGLSYTQTAAELGLSKKTVAQYVHQIALRITDDSARPTTRIIRRFLGVHFIDP